MDNTITSDVVTKSYPAGRGAESGSPAVDTFTACVEAGITTVLLGSSDCSKTTLLYMVSRMVEPSSGRVPVDGEDVVAHDAVALRRFIGYVMQNVGLLSHQRVIDNIVLIPHLRGADHHDARCRALGLMDILDLGRDLVGRYPHQLPSGQTRWVGVARAPAAGPETPLMDEPLGVIDPLVRRDPQREMACIQAGLGKIIIFIIHDVGEALALGDEIILLREGTQIAQRGSGPQLLAGPADDFVARFLNLDDAARQFQLTDVAESQIALDRAGRAVGHLTNESSSEAKKQT